MQIVSYLSPCTKLKSRGIKDLNIKPDTPTLKEQKVGNSIKLIGTGTNYTCLSLLTKMSPVQPLPFLCDLETYSRRSLVLCHSTFKGLALFPEASGVQNSPEMMTI